METSAPHDCFHRQTQFWNGSWDDQYYVIRAQRTVFACNSTLLVILHDFCMHCINLSLSTSACLHMWEPCLLRMSAAVCLAYCQMRTHFLHHHMLCYFCIIICFVISIDTRLLFSWRLDRYQIRVWSTDSVSLASFTAGTRMRTNKVPGPHAEAKMRQCIHPIITD